MHAGHTNTSWTHQKKKHETIIYDSSRQSITNSLDSQSPHHGRRSYLYPTILDGLVLSDGVTKMVALAVFMPLAKVSSLRSCNHGFLIASSQHTHAWVARTSRKRVLVATIRVVGLGQGNTVAPTDGESKNTSLFRAFTRWCTYMPIRCSAVSNRRSHSDANHALHPPTYRNSMGKPAQDIRGHGGRRQQPTSLAVTAPLPSAPSSCQQHSVRGPSAQHRQPQQAQAQDQKRGAPRRYQ